MPSDLEPEELWRIWLAEAGFDPPQIDGKGVGALIQWVEAGAWPHALAMLQAAHKNSWFSEEGLANVFRSTTGAVVPATAPCSLNRPFVFLPFRCMGRALAAVVGNDKLEATDSYMLLVK